MSSLAPHPFFPGEELTDETALPEALTVDISEAPMNALGEDGARVQEVGDGVVVDFGGGDDPYEDGIGDPDDHNANLAEFLSESVLSGIAQEVEEWVKGDIESRKAWFERLADGLVLMGVAKAPSAGAGALKEVEKVNHPLIAEAQVQFQARAIAELIPPTGPAKGLVLGEKSKETEDQAERVADYQNYQLMVEDEDFYPETDRMLFMLSGAGSQFKKVYRDGVLDRNVSRWVRSEHFIVPYGAVTLESAPRYTHQIPYDHNTLRKLQVSGFYRDVDVGRPTQGTEVNDELKSKQDEARGEERAVNLADDMEHTVFECHCYYDLPGFEDRYAPKAGQEQGDPTGIGLPYIISVEYESRKVLSIRRNWKENDPARKKRMAFVHYPMFPGDGFYSYGFWHMIGGLGHAATGLLKTIMMGAAFASMQGGFKARGAKSETNVELEWGVYKEVDMTWEELSKCFYTPQFKEPSEALFKVLGLIEEACQRFASTTENMVGDANNTGPVGTTVALIEQGSKVYTGIHKRLHFAQGKELKLLAELNAEHLPEEGYPYQVHGASREIMRSDFDERVDVVPVSDPNIFSSTQRIAIAQSLVQRSTEAPDLYDRMKVEKRFLEAMRVSDPDDVLVNKAKISRADPVTENALFLVGKPAKVFLDQDHDAHMAVHQSQIEEFATRPQGDPIASRLLPMMMAHQSEHMAQGMRLKMAAQMGIQLPPMNLDAEGDEPIVEILPAAVENQIAQRAAMVIMQMPKPQQPGAEQAGQLEQRAAELEQQAQALEKDRAAVQGEAQKLAFGKREAALQQQVRDMKSQAQGSKLIEAALQRIEKALGQAGGE